MGILLCKSSDCGVVVSGAEVVGFRFLVEVLTAVAEGIGVATARVFLVAERIVVVAFCHRTGTVGKRDHIAVGVDIRMGLGGLRVTVQA